jgi:multidrug efflux pump subunit AcrB
VGYGGYIFMELNLEQVQQFLETNKENENVSNYLQELSKVTADGVNAFIETDEGKKLLQPKLDSYMTKGLDSWKKNNLQKIIDEAVAKANPSETPEQKEIRELKEKFANIEREKVRESLKNKALTVAGDKKIPTSLIDFLIGQDEEGTLANLGQFETAMNDYVKAQVEDRLKGSYTPPGGGGGTPPGITKEQFSKMNYKEKMEIYDSDPELYKQLKG